MTSTNEVGLALDRVRNQSGVILEDLQLSPLRASTCNIPRNAKWAQNGVTVAGGNGYGNGINQLDCPLGLVVDDDQRIYVARRSNNRVMEWQSDAKDGKIVASGNGQGNGDHQFNTPLK
ncbi:unnamed protein product [Rotaria sp. Silwood1]|nr:unnamed protein product [Rotaria sp. Silwood1]CAF3547544.1 unnamed protein product [Rotaria sp. Silwood1]CAF3610842.1 unnamed protein product [Rotaria sp. Silwood1]CAF4938015.1 unnamed protein product [Rotaria sp. Silwood1]CAF4955560.1 unnamed protein product [Rotaria sp. Silwood1]